MTFRQKLQRAVTSSGSLLSVGLDPDPARIPAPLKKQFPETDQMIFEFCRRVVEATKPHTGIYKANMAFFEALGSKGWAVLEQLLEEIPAGKVVIADAKRGDIGTTAQKYKEAFFDHLGVDAVTLNPLMGIDTIEPFLDDETKGVFVLTVTSNRGSADFVQRRFQGRMSLGEYFAEELSKKNQSSKTEIGMVVGATQPEAAGPILQAFPDATLLIPGIGAQGGDLTLLREALKHHTGIPVVHSSRAIIYSGENNENWEEAVSSKAAELKQLLMPLTEKFIR